MALLNMCPKKPNNIKKDVLKNYAHLFILENNSIFASK